MFKRFRLKHSAFSVLACCLLTGTPAYAEDQHWVQRINMSGVVEVEYGSSEAFDGTKSSDIAVATVEVGMDAKVNDQIEAHIVFLHEEDETDFSVDAAYLDMTLGPVVVTAGATGAPFGSFATNMLSDPLTMQISETAETLLQVGTELGPLHAAFYVFNGTTKEAGADDVADQTGVHLAYVMESEGTNIDIGVDYISNIADSDAIQEKITGDPKEVKAYVPAQIVHANFQFGSFHFIAEHLVADQFDAGEISFNGKGAEITATNLEVGLDMTIAGVESTVAVGMQTTEEALALGMPKEKTIAAISFGIAKFTALTFEYANSTDYGISDSDGTNNGTGKSVNSFTAQIAVGF